MSNNDKNITTVNKLALPIWLYGIEENEVHPLKVVIKLFVWEAVSSEGVFESASNPKLVCSKALQLLLWLLLPKNEV